MQRRLATSTLGAGTQEWLIAGNINCHTTTTKIIIPTVSSVKRRISCGDEAAVVDRSCPKRGMQSLTMMKHAYQ